MLKYKTAIRYLVIGFSVRMDSDSSDNSDDDLFELLDFLHDFGAANDRRHESETESETEGNINCPINRLVPFYERRKDIFDMFNDEQIVRTFRFDKQAILYITGNKIKFIRGTVPNLFIVSHRFSRRRPTKKVHKV